MRRLNIQTDNNYKNHICGFYGPMKTLNTFFLKYLLSKDKNEFYYIERYYELYLPDKFQWVSSPYEDPKL